MEYLNKIHYEISANREIQAINKKSWQDFLAGEAARPYSLGVLDGWRRAKELGVDPLQKRVSHMFAQEELVALRAANELLLEVSKPILSIVNEFVTGDDFIIALSEKSGCILDVWGNEKLKNDVRRGSWEAGADWSEKSAGNNIVGTALYLNKPVMVMGYEHYCKCCHWHAGAGAPIHGPSGAIIGAIAIAGDFEKIHPHTLGMIVAAAKAIELQMDTKQNLYFCDMANTYKSVIINTMTEGLISVDENYNVTLCNNNACCMLKMKEEQLLSANLNTLLPETVVQKLRNKATGSIDKEMVFFNGSSYIKFICSSQPIWEQDAFRGLVLVINEFARVERLASKLKNTDVFFTFDNIIGKHPTLGKALYIARNSANTDSNVLLLGESGTGKDVFAQAIHNASKRRNGPYVAINCAAIPKDLINSELFGYSEGAFTGAKKGGNIGKVELANHGTLFLDEIGEMPLEQQTVLLRLLENRSIQKIGDADTKPVDIRIIAATNKDLLDEVKNKRFRQDLYYRLNVFTIRIPSLRERLGDIPALAKAFVHRLCQKKGLDPIELDEEAVKPLMAYSWPGNIRELQNVLERVSMMSTDGRITAELISNVGDIDNGSANYWRSPKEAGYQASYSGKDRFSLDAQTLEKILVKNKWNITKTCLELGISRPTLYRKLDTFGINLNRTKQN